VDPSAREVRWLALVAASYEAVGQSGLIDLGPAVLAEQIDWPPTETG
jgi:hypothetical protein